MENEQILLVPAAPELAEEVLAYYCRNWAFLAPYEGVHDPDFFTLPGQRALLMEEARVRAEKSGFRFYIRWKETGEIIGLAALNNIIWGAFRSCYLGYKLDEAHRGRGIMPQAVEMLADYAFGPLGLHRIEANVMPRNRASLRVLEKCGFVCEGCSPRYLNINGVWEDHVHMVRRNLAMEGTGPAHPDKRTGEADGKSG